MRVCATPGCPTLTTDTYCPACATKRDRERGSRQQRGYDRAHEHERARLLPLAYGQPCPHCGERMWPHDELHLDHTEDRIGYVGIVHARCNTSDAARRGNATRASHM